MGLQLRILFALRMHKFSYLAPQNILHTLEEVYCGSFPAGGQRTNVALCDREGDIIRELARDRPGI